MLCRICFKRDLRTVYAKRTPLFSILKRSYFNPMYQHMSSRTMHSVLRRSMCRVVSFTPPTSSLGIDSFSEQEIKIATEKILKSSLNDEIIDEQCYLNEFEEFTKSKQYIEAYKESVSTSETAKQSIDNLTVQLTTESDSPSFEKELKQKSEDIILDSIKNIDTTNALQKLLNKTNLIDLTGEIQKIISFVKVVPFIDKSKKEATMTFLMSLDYLVKGLFTHWQISLLDESESVNSKIIREKLKQEATMVKYDIKYNILIGDQFHAKAYHMTSMLGNNELCKILATTIMRK